MNEEFPGLESPQTAAGNWRKFDSFAWFDQPDDADNWYIFYTHNRDSDLLTQSNAEQIDKAMKPFVESGDARAEARELAELWGLDDLPV